MPVIKHTQAATLTRDAIVLDLGDLRRQGEAILADATRRAAETLEHAAAERERLISGAAAEGHAQGLARGLEEGRAQGQQEGREAALAEAMSRLGALETGWAAAMDEFLSRREQLLHEAQRDVLRLALAIGEKVTKRAIAAGPEAVAAAQVEAVLGLISRPTELVIAAHPEDVAALQRVLPRLMQRFSAARHVELVEDAGLQRGSCIARTRGQGADALAAGGGEIDASIATQLERIAAALLPGDAASSSATEPGGAA